MNMNNLFNHLSWRETAFNVLIKHGVVDAHHHMIGRRQRRKRNPGLLDWLEESYLLCFTFPSTGTMQDEWSNHNLPKTRRIRSLLPFLKLTRITTYYQIIKRGLLSSFGFDIDKLNETNWQDLDKLIRQVNKREDWFEEGSKKTHESLLWCA